MENGNNSLKGRRFKDSKPNFPRFSRAVGTLKLRLERKIKICLGCHRQIPLIFLEERGSRKKIEILPRKLHT